MSKYGLKIKNFKSGALYGYNLGVRQNHDTKDAMFVNSLFKDYLEENNLLTVYGRDNNESTRDIICIEFTFGSRSFEEEIKHFNKTAKKYGGKITKANIVEIDPDTNEVVNEQVLNNIQELINLSLEQSDKYEKKYKEEIREQYYINGVSIEYNTTDRKGNIKSTEIIHYKMLYRTPGKAKKGSCMFINEKIYDQARDFLTMGIKIPYNNSPIVEIGAYSSLVTSGIEGKIKINPKNILIVKDVDSFFKTTVISVETDEDKHCIAKEIEKYKLKNTLFDGQALIDSSIFPDWGDGYVLLRHHFCKMAAFNTNIQKFFKDWYGEEYTTATVKDMFGNEHYVKDIELITTDNAMKWLKFKDITYDYWCDWVYKNGCQFGIVKTAHKSKLGNVQRMSYQMINSLDLNIMDKVCQTSVEYVELLKRDDEEFLKYLEKNQNFSNDFEVLIALCKQNKDFVRSEYYRDRKKEIIRNYTVNLKSGKVIQEGDNLVIVGSPYAMLLHAVGEDVEKDDTFSQEEGTIQCYTERFNDGEYLAEFRNPFNGYYNLGYLHNIYHEKFKKYFNFGKQIIAINMIGTDFQDRNNGSDQDSDSIYTTNQSEIVEYAKFCYKNYHTIVNNIPKDTNHYTNDLLSYAKIDNNLAASQTAIGESSNLAQLALTYTYSFPNEQKYKDYVCILSVLAQLAIDSAKRCFDLDINAEIERIKRDMDIDINKYPKFWLLIRKNFNKISDKAYRDMKKVEKIDKNDIESLKKYYKDRNEPEIKEQILKRLNDIYINENKINPDLKCPMNYLYDIEIKNNVRGSNAEPTLPMSEFFIKHEVKATQKATCKKVEELIQKYSFDLFKKQQEEMDKEDYLLLRSDFDTLIEDLSKTNLSRNYLGFMSWLIDRAFVITPSQMRHKNSSMLNKNKSLFIKTLYKINPDVFLKCFKSKQ